MPLDIVLGLQWGDEGKGKIVDRLAAKYACIARFQGGPNAGHTLYVNGKKHVLHQIPSGIFHPHAVCVIGNGVIIDPIKLGEEMQQLDEMGIALRSRLLLSSRAHVILPTHRLIDQAQETARGNAAIGSTLKGIGPTYVDKYAREGIRLCDLMHPDFEERVNNKTKKHLAFIESSTGIAASIPDLKPFLKACEQLRGFQIMDVENYLHELHFGGENILAEGAQGSLLDVDFGEYPFVTSSSTLSAGACIGLGMPPQSIERVMGVFKAYSTRVGNGSLPYEIEGEQQGELQKLGNEFGSTTGRPRRCGWLDLGRILYTCKLNGVTHLTITKWDIVSQMDTYQIVDIKGDVHTFQNAKSTKSETTWNAESENRIKWIEDQLQLPVALVSIGTARDSVIERHQW